MKPFPHQEEVARLVQEHDKGIFDIACGCGKSYSMMLSSKHFFVTVVFAPTKNLVSQLAENFASMNDAKVFLVNSDNPVNMTQLRKAKMSKKKRIVIVANYQSVHVVKDICETTDLQIDAVFLDEAHNVTSDKKRSVFHKESSIKELSDTETTSGSDNDSDTEDVSDTNSITSGSSYTETSNGSTSDSNERFVMSDISRITSKKTFSFTATPTKTMLKHPEIYGPVLLRYTYAQGVIDGHVKNIDTIIECYGDKDKSCLDAGYERLIPAISRFIEEGNFKRIIVYTSRVKECGKKLATVDGLYDNRHIFPDEFHIHTVSANTPLGVRDDIFNTFRSISDETHVILSCMTISEGIDLPSCDAVVILDSSKSVVKIIQRTLRACRLTPDERQCGQWRNAAVFYPINVPESSLIELLEAGANQAKEVITKHIHRHDFEFAMAVVHFLKQDLGLEPLFDYKCRDGSKKPDNLRDEPSKEDVQKSGDTKKPTGHVTFQFEGNFEWTSEKFQESTNYVATNMKVIGLDDRFEENLEILRAFVHKNNRLPSSSAKTPEEKELGSWCSERRKQYKKTQLSEERIKDLESIQQWSWDPIEHQYQKSLKDLKKFINENNRLPSHGSNISEEKQLASWCSIRRKDYKKNQLSQERIQDLESIPQWSWDPFEGKYQKSLEDFKKFIKENNRLPSSMSKNLEEKHLGKWCSERRKQYKKNQLSQERIKDLESIPQWSWDPFEGKYQKSLDDLKKFIKENNRLPSQHAKNPEEKVLGSWCSTRRIDYKGKRLSQERMQDLESIPQWSWDPIEDQYQKSFEDLKKFIKDNNRLPSYCAKNSVEKQLGSWCSNRRNDYNNNQLSEERIKDLENIPHWSWDTIEGQYQKSLDDLKKFIKKNNRLPSTIGNNPDEKQLGSWSSVRRKEYKNNKLSQERIKDLESISQWSWDPIEDQYQKSLDDLKKFIKKNNRLPLTTEILPKEKQVGVWCSVRRKEYKNNQLSQERIKDLESIPQWSWDPFEGKYQKSLEDLKKFIKENNRLPSQTSKNPEEKQLGIWCGSRRKDYKKNQLSQERIKDLESIPQWSWDQYQKSFEDQYQKSFEDLKKFIKDNNRLPSSMSKNLEEKHLGKWCVSRHGDYKKNQLSQERIKDLESIPQWSWDPIEDQYQKSFEDLKKFIKENNRLPSTIGKNPDEKQLGRWCSSRRKDYKNNQLSQERIKDLERILQWSWDLFESNYATNLSKVAEFVAKHGKLPTISTDKYLYSWCSVRREEYKKGKISDERIKELETIPHWFWDGNNKKTKSTKLPQQSSSTTTSAPNKQPRQLSDLSEYHKRFKTMNSSTLHKEFQEDRELFNEYHEVAEKNWSGFKQEERPVYLASQLIHRIHKQVNMSLTIADFGAGIGTLKELISQEHILTGFDHVSVKDWIIPRDMRDTGLEGVSQDVCVFSMSLWGSNWEEYLIEASRVLKPNGYCIIINKTRGWFVDEENNPLPQQETRIGKALINADLVTVKVSGLESIFTTCVAMKPLAL